MCSERGATRGVETCAGGRICQVLSCTERVAPRETSKRVQGSLSIEPVRRDEYTRLAANFGPESIAPSVGSRRSTWPEASLMRMEQDISLSVAKRIPPMFRGFLRRLLANTCVNIARVRHRARGLRPILHLATCFFVCMAVGRYGPPAAAPFLPPLRLHAPQRTSPFAVVAHPMRRRLRRTSPSSASCAWPACHSNTSWHTRCMVDTASRFALSLVLPVSSLASPARAALTVWPCAHAPQMPCVRPHALAHLSYP